MELYKKLVDIFEIDTINIDKANRSTLKKYAIRTKFQKRRESFYSVCEEGTKSKVAICKTEDRPQWVHNLDTLKTKQLRAQLKGFLKHLGVFVDPAVTNLDKLAKKRNWHAVVYMDDESKTGGTATFGTPAHSHYGIPNAPPASAPRGLHPLFRGGRGRGGRGGGHVAAPAFVPAAGGLPLNHPEQVAMAANQQALMNSLRNNDVNRGRLDRIDELLRSQKQEASLDGKFAELTKLLERNFQSPPSLPPPPPPLPAPASADSSAIVPHETNIKIVTPQGNNCYILDEDVECICKPETVKTKHMSKEAQAKLKRLAEQKAITCSKIDLLKCLSVEFDTQDHMWKKFSKNPQGDYLASFTAAMVKDLTCGKNVCFSGPDLHTMKAVAQCFNISQNLCKGHKDGLARFHDRDAIDEEYTLGHIGYEELLANVRKYNDKWSKAAYRNRIPDPVSVQTMICENPETGNTNIVNLPTETVVPPQPLVPVPQPVVTGVGGMAGAPGMPGPPGAAGQAGRTVQLPPAPPAPTPFPVIPVPPSTGVVQPTKPIVVGGENVIEGVEPWHEMPTGMPSQLATCDTLQQFMHQAYRGERTIEKDIYKYVKFVADFLQKHASVIDPEFARFIKNSMVQLYFKHYDKTKFNFLLLLLQNYCVGDTWYPPPAPEDDCKRMDYYLKAIKDTWLTRAEWRQFMQEVDELSRVNASQADYQSIIAWLRMVHGSGFVQNVPSWTHLHRTLMQWCQTTQIKPGDECINFILKMLAIRSAGPESVNLYDREQLNQQIKDWTPQMDPKRRNLVPALLRDLKSGSNTVSRKAFMWLTWNLYSICKGIRLSGFKGDDCDKIDFLILTEWHMKYLEPESKKELFDAMPEIIARAAPQHKEETEDLWLRYRFGLLTRDDKKLKKIWQTPTDWGVLSKEAWGRFRWLVQDACKRAPRVKPDPEARDFCEALLDRILHVYTGHANQDETELVNNEVNAFIALMRKDTQHLANKVWGRMLAHDQTLDPARVEYFQMVMYLICNHSKGSSEFCSRIDFLLMRAGQPGIGKDGWVFLKKHIPGLIARSLTTADIDWCKLRWERLENHGRIPKEEMDKFRKIIYENCMRQGQHVEEEKEEKEEKEDITPPEDIIPPPDFAPTFPVGAPAKASKQVPFPIRVPVEEKVEETVDPVVAEDIVPHGVKVPVVKMPLPIKQKQKYDLMNLKVRHEDEPGSPKYDKRKIIPPHRVVQPPIKGIRWPAAEKVDEQLLQKVLTDLQNEKVTGVPAVLPPGWVRTEPAPIRPQVPIQVGGHDAAQIAASQSVANQAQAVIQAQLNQLASVPPRRKSKTLYDFLPITGGTFPSLAAQFANQQAVQATQTLQQDLQATAATQALISEHQQQANDALAAERAAEEARLQQVYGNRVPLSGLATNTSMPAPFTVIVFTTPQYNPVAGRGRVPEGYTWNSAGFLHRTNVVVYIPEVYGVAGTIYDPVIDNYRVATQADTIVRTDVAPDSGFITGRLGSEGVPSGHDVMDYQLGHLAPSKILSPEDVTYYSDLLNAEQYMDPNRPPNRIVDSAADGAFSFGSMGQVLQAPIRPQRPQPADILAAQQADLAALQATQAANAAHLASLAPLPGRLGAMAQAQAQSGIGLKPSWNVGQQMQPASFGLGKPAQQAGLDAIADTLIGAGQQGAEFLHNLAQKQAEINAYANALAQAQGPLPQDPAPHLGAVGTAQPFLGGTTTIPAAPPTGALEEEKRPEVPGPIKPTPGQGAAPTPGLGAAAPAPAAAPTPGGPVPGVSAPVDLAAEFAAQMAPFQKKPTIPTGGAPGLPADAPTGAHVPAGLGQLNPALVQIGQAAAQQATQALMQEAQQYMSVADKTYAAQVASGTVPRPEFSDLWRQYLLEDSTGDQAAAGERARLIFAAAGLPEPVVAGYQLSGLAAGVSSAPPYTGVAGPTQPGLSSLYAQEQARRRAQLQLLANQQKAAAAAYMAGHGVGAPLVPTPTPAQLYAATLQAAQAGLPPQKTDYTAALQAAQTGMTPHKPGIPVGAPVGGVGVVSPLDAATISAVLNLAQAPVGPQIPSRIIGDTGILPLTMPTMADKPTIQVDISGTQAPEAPTEDPASGPKPSGFELNDDPCIAIQQVLQALMRDKDNRLLQSSLLGLMDRVSSMTLATTAGQTLGRLSTHFRTRGIGASGNTPITDSQLRAVFDAAWEACQTLERSGDALSSKDPATQKHLTETFYSGGLKLKETLDKAADYSWDEDPKEYWKQQDIADETAKPTYDKPVQPGILPGFVPILGHPGSRKKIEDLIDALGTSRDGRKKRSTDQTEYTGKLARMEGYSLSQLRSNPSLYSEYHTLHKRVSELAHEHNFAGPIPKMISKADIPIRTAALQRSKHHIAQEQKQLAHKGKAAKAHVTKLKNARSENATKLKAATKKVGELKKRESQVLKKGRKQTLNKKQSDKFRKDVTTVQKAKASALQTVQFLRDTSKALDRDILSMKTAQEIMKDKKDLLRERNVAVKHDLAATQRAGEMKDNRRMVEEGETRRRLAVGQNQRDIGRTYGDYGNAPQFPNLGQEIDETMRLGGVGKVKKGAERDGKRRKGQPGIEKEMMDELLDVSELKDLGAQRAAARKRFKTPEHTGIMDIGTALSEEETVGTPDTRSHSEWTKMASGESAKVKKLKGEIATQQKSWDVYDKQSFVVPSRHVEQLYAALVRVQRTGGFTSDEVQNIANAVRPQLIKLFPLGAKKKFRAETVSHISSEQDKIVNKLVVMLRQGLGQNVTMGVREGAELLRMARIDRSWNDKFGDEMDTVRRHLDKLKRNLGTADYKQSQYKFNATKTKPKKGIRVRSKQMKKQKRPESPTRSPRGRARTPSPGRKTEKRERERAKTRSPPKVRPPKPSRIVEFRKKAKYGPQRGKPNVGGASPFFKPRPKQR